MRGFLARFPDSTYTVVETPSMVAAAHMPGVTFATAIPSACDVFFSSGTLQCLPNPYDVLAAGFRSARHAVVLTRNSFAKREWFRVHKSRLFDGGPVPEGFEDRLVVYPNRTVLERRIMQIAGRHGFILSGSEPDMSGAIRYRDKVYGVNLMFTRL